MKIYVLSAHARDMFDESSQDGLEAAGEVVPVTETHSWRTLFGPFASEEEKIIAIDPRWCGWQVPSDVFDTLRNVRAICLQTTSFGWIDIDRARRLNIPVTNVRGFSTVAVAEWATLMVLLVARKAPLLARESWKAQFTPAYLGVELNGRVAGVVGMGRIGAALARNMAGFGMDVQYWSRSTVNSDYRRVALDELVRTSDVVLPAVAKNEETRGLITDAMLSSMRKTAVFVSITDEVYNHELLLEMAARGDIGGYAFEQAGEHVNYKGNVWASPQMAWYTDRSVANNAQQWAASMIDAAHGLFPNKVN